MLPTAALASTLLAAALTPSAYATSLRQLAPQPYTCSIEDGFDYVGHDISNKQGPVESCCDTCRTTEGCKAWTWTDFNGGTCWLKWRRGEIVVNKNAKSARLGGQPSDVCQLRLNIDYVGNDLARVDGTNPFDCCRVCRKTLGCRASTWSDYRGGSCWLKSKVTQVAYKGGVHSVQVFQPEYPMCANAQTGIDYVGNDIGNARSAKREACCDYCETTPNCRAYTWTNYAGGTCWLKSRASNATNTEGAISAKALPNIEDTCYFRDDTDYVGSDIANLPGKDVTECCAKCQGFDGCNFFTWSNYNGGTCWLKKRDEKAVEKKGVHSGYVAWA